MQKSVLTEEQKRRMEENRRKALAIREANKHKTSNPTTNANNMAITSSGPPSKVQKIQPGFGTNINIRAVQSTSKPTSSPFAMISALPTDGKSNKVSKIQMIDHQPMNQPTLSNYFKPNSGQSKGVSINYKTSSSSTSTSTVQEGNGVVMSASNKSPPCLKITFKLESANVIIVEFPFCLAMNDTLKQFQSANFDQTIKKWKIGVKEYLPLVKKLDELKKSEQLKTSISTESVASSVISLIVSSSINNTKDIDLSERLDQDFINNMFPFQREGVKFGIKKEGRCMIADEMGLGKTVQALGIACWFKSDWPLVIICPASVAVTWKQAALKWLKFLREDEVEVADSLKSDRFPKTPVIIMSYERMKRNLEDVFKAKPNVLIFDESHSIKEEKAGRTKAALEITRKSKRVILLSGTPALSRPMELLTQIRAVNHQLFPNKHEFGVRYCNAQLRYTGRLKIWDYKGHSNTDELKTLLESTIMIRRMKKDVLRDLPKKSRIVVDLPLHLTKEEKAQMEAYRVRVGDKNMNAQTRDDLMQWYHDTAKLKINSVVKYIDDKLKMSKQTGKKFIVFAHHKTLVDAITEWLQVNKISFIVIVGDTLPKYRQECCDAFQNRPNIRIAVVSIIAAGVGITLTAAHNVIFTELFWNPGMLVQAEDRAHRIGQENNVTIEYLISKGTVDELIWSIVGKKISVLTKVGLASENMKGSSRSGDQKVIEDYFKKISLETLKKEGLEEEEIPDFDDIPDDDIQEVKVENDKSSSSSVPSPVTLKAESMGSIGSDFQKHSDSDIEEIVQELQPGPSDTTARQRDNDSRTDIEEQFPDDDVDILDITTPSPTCKDQNSSQKTTETGDSEQHETLLLEDIDFDDFEDDVEFLN